MKDLNDNIIISLPNFAFFPNAATPFIYFNVKKTDGATGINSMGSTSGHEEYDVSYFNLGGKKLNKNELSKLPRGTMYFKKYRPSKGGAYKTKKVLKLYN